MNIIAVDDEHDALWCLEETIRIAMPGCELCAFTKPKEALEHAKSHSVTVAFLDIEMRGMTGLDLALRLKEINPKTNIVFVTGYSDYTGSALKLRASGYIMKPASADQIREEIENLRYPLAMRQMYVQCFGAFEVFIDGRPLSFSRVKCKELLAYLIDCKGAVVNTGDIIGTLWGDEPVSSSILSQVRTIIAELCKTLKNAGVDGWVIKRRNSFAVDTKKIPCDYYDFLNGDVSALNTYRGEYMMQYSWAEMTNGWLTRKIHRGG
jgi:two-component SAPR family response regulator